MAKRRWMWIALVAAVLVGGIAIMLAVRGERVSGGRATRDEVIAATFDAMAAGDVDALVALIDPVAMYGLAVDCRDDEDDDEGDKDGAGGDREEREEKAQRARARDPHAVRDQARVDYAPLVARARGLHIEVVSIAEAAPPNRVAKADPMMPGCVATHTLAFHRFRVALRIRDGEQPRDQEVVVATVEVAGRWFLSTPPTLRR